MSLENLKQGIVALGFIVLIAAAIGISLNEFRDDQTTNSYAYNITNSGLEGVSNASDYFDTIGTLLGVGALIAVVLGAFYFMRK